VPSDRPPPALPRAFPGGILRRLALADLAAFQAYRGDPELARYQGWSAMTDDEAAAFLCEMAAMPLLRAGEWLQLGIAEPDGGRLVGDIGLCLASDDSHAEIGFTLAAHAQGRGVAAAAVRAAIAWLFEGTGVRQVRGITDARNLASIRLMERVGMRRVAVRDGLFRGERCVEHIHAVDRTA
jgi:aminoglycoside 6'-N-acetyltransferase